MNRRVFFGGTLTLGVAKLIGLPAPSATSLPVPAVPATVTAMERIKELDTFSGYDPYDGSMHTHSFPTDPYTSPHVHSWTLPAQTSIPIMLVDPTVAPIRVLMQWYGDPRFLPTGWVRADGTNGTPDLTERFVVNGG